jgi:hypothetical protein
MLVGWGLFNLNYANVPLWAALFLAVGAALLVFGVGSCASTPQWASVSAQWISRLRTIATGVPISDSQANPRAASPR